MNRKEKRKIEKNIPGYEDTVKKAAQEAVDGLEKMFKKVWVESDSTINNGELWHEGNNDEDDIYNL